MCVVSEKSKFRLCFLKNLRIGFIFILKFLGLYIFKGNRAWSNLVFGSLGIVSECLFSLGYLLYLLVPLFQKIITLGLIRIFLNL